MAKLSMVCGFSNGVSGCFLFINKLHSWGQSALCAMCMLALSVHCKQTEFGE